MGNTTFDGRYTYVYDELNRLVRVEQDGALVAVYGFDASNRRIVKTVGSTTTHYLYDTESNLIAEATADGTISREYLYLDGELIAINDYQDNPGLYYAINDHLGTPQQLIQADGTIVWQAAYLPFGSAQVTVEQVVNNIRFPGQYYDQETGLHYNWHRFYDPETGRYITADPIGLEGGINLYSYANQNPINEIDPTGLDSIEYKRCYDKLQKRIRCEKEAFKKFKKCTGDILPQNAACIAAAAKGCLYTGAYYPECMAAAVSACSAALAPLRAKCLWGLSKDLKECEDKYPTRDDCDC